MRTVHRLKSASFHLNVIALLFGIAAFVMGDGESLRFWRAFSCALCGFYFGVSAYASVKRRW